MARPNVVKLVGVDSKNGEIIAVYIFHELSGYRGKFVPERPHGEWIRHIDDLYPEESTEECSVCHEEQRITGNDDDFCPKCGADMRKSGE